MKNNRAKKSENSKGCKIKTNEDTDPLFGRAS